MKREEGNEMQNNIMVSVVCTTYNHEEFIKDAIDGILNQKTNFKFELIIHDDASTDGTAGIIREYADKYPEIIRPIFQTENQKQKGNNMWLLFILPRIQGKYIALCEGDDYWIDENKLQLQTDFMEGHPDYSMCMHNAVKVNYETGEKVWLNTFEEDGTYSQEDQIQVGLGSGFPAFASYFLRTHLWKDMPEFFWTGGVLDYPLRQYYASKGKTYYFKKPMSVYRFFTPGSYMRRIEESQLGYNNYTMKMIQFYEQLDDYLEKKFHHLFVRKIISDYFGFCLSIDCESGKRKAEENGLNQEIILQCYKYLSEDYLDEGVRRLIERTEHVFIYGASRAALNCSKQLEKHGVSFEGFVVSDGNLKCSMLEDKKVLYLSEVIAQYENPGFIFGVQPINLDAIEANMKKNKIDNYCIPYNITI